MKKKAFTLVELIVVITILAILWTIAFISLSDYSKEARDSKRITDTSNLLSKINVENVRWINMSELINPLEKKTNILTINSKKEDWLQGYPNFNALKEPEENFLDPKSKHRYPFAYAIWWEWKESYNFMQMATVSEKDWRARLVWNYYKFNNDTDSPSLFVQDWKDWEDIDDDYIVDNWEVPPYDIWVPVAPKPEEKYSCKWTLPENIQTSNTNNLIEDTQYQNTDENDKCYYSCLDTHKWNTEKTECIKIPTWPDDCIEDWTFWNWVECVINPHKDQNFSDNNKLSFSKEWYPGCDTPNIILTDWNNKYEIAACNAWANIATDWKECYNATTCRSAWTVKLWYFFQYWRNKWFSFEDTSSINTLIPWEVWLKLEDDIYWFVNNKNLSSISGILPWANSDIDKNWWTLSNWQWPCPQNYKIPSSEEMQNILNIWWWNWINSNDKFKNFSESLKIPLSWMRNRLDWAVYIDRFNFWLSNNKLDTEWWTFIISQDFNTIQIIVGWWRATGLPIRCMKN